MFFLVSTIVNILLNVLLSHVNWSCRSMSTWSSEYFNIFVLLKHKLRSSESQLLFCTLCCQNSVGQINLCASKHSLVSLLFTSKSLILWYFVCHLKPHSLFCHWLQTRLLFSFKFYTFKVAVCFNPLDFNLNFFCSLKQIFSSKLVWLAWHTNPF